MLRRHRRGGHREARRHEFAAIPPNCKLAILLGRVKSSGIVARVYSSPAVIGDHRRGGHLTSWCRHPIMVFPLEHPKSDARPPASEAPMSPESKVAIDTVPLPERTVRVTVPARIAFDLGSMNKVTASILGRLGCPGCHSGWDIRFDIARNFAVDEKLNVRETAGGGGIING